MMDCVLNLMDFILNMMHSPGGRCTRHPMISPPLVSLRRAAHTPRSHAPRSHAPRSHAPRLGRTAAWSSTSLRTRACAKVAIEIPFLLGNICWKCTQNVESPLINGWFSVENGDYFGTRGTHQRSSARLLLPWPRVWPRRELTNFVL